MTSDLVLVVQQNLTSAGVVSRACCHGERRCVRPRTPGDGFHGLVILDSPALTSSTTAVSGA